MYTVRVYSQTIVGASLLVEFHHQLLPVEAADLIRVVGKEPFGAITLSLHEVDEIIHKRPISSVTITIAAQVMRAYEVNWLQKYQDETPTYLEIKFPEPLTMPLDEDNSAAKDAYLNPWTITFSSPATATLHQELDKAGFGTNAWLRTYPMFAPTIQMLWNDIERDPILPTAANIKYLRIISLWLDANQPQSSTNGVYAP